MDAVKTTAVIFIIVSGFINFSYQLNCNGINNCFEVPADYSLLTPQNNGNPYANPEKQQIELIITSAIAATCISAGIFPDPANTANYYVCLVDATSGFIKYDYSCPSGQNFDSTTLQCTPATVTTTVTPTTVAPTTVTIPTTASSATPAPLQCMFQGIFPMPRNCKMYYRCSATLIMYNFTCPEASYFNEFTLLCSLIITPSCQQQISQNSTTTIPTTISTTLTTTSLASTTTLAPSTTTLGTTTMTTTVSTPTKPFSCTMAGIFPDPTSCKSYYRCSSTNIAFQYFCPGRSNFNEYTKTCSLAITPRCQLLL